MASAIRKPMTLSAFLEWEAKQPLKHEFDGFGPIAMAVGTQEHASIQRNLAISIGGRLRGKPCRFAGSDLKIEVAGRIRYPDGFVYCTPQPRGTLVIREPVVIFEVLSETSASTDLVLKAREYGATSSVQRYVALDPEAMAGTMFERVGGEWVGRLIGVDTILRMPEIDIELPLSELYDGVDLGPGDVEVASS